MHLKLVRLSWIIQIDPKCNHQCPYMKEAEGVYYRREGDVTMALKMEEGTIGQKTQGVHR